MYIIILHNTLHLVVWKAPIELSAQLLAMTNNVLESNRSQSEIPNSTFHNATNPVDNCLAQRQPPDKLSQAESVLRI